MSPGADCTAVAPGLYYARNPHASPGLHVPAGRPDDSQSGRPGLPPGPPMTVTDWARHRMREGKGRQPAPAAGRREQSAPERRRPATPIRPTGCRWTKSSARGTRGQPARRREARDTGHGDGGDEQLSMQQLLEAEEASVREVRRGQVVDGTVVRIDPDEVLVDIGLKSEGLIPGRELSSIEEELGHPLRVGDTILVYVVTTETPEGHALLSFRRAGTERFWRRAQQQVETGRGGGGPGGGVQPRGAWSSSTAPGPSSPSPSWPTCSAPGDSEEEQEQVAEQLRGMVGQTLKLKVIEADRKRNRLILSERQANRELRSQRRDQLLLGARAGADPQRPGLQRGLLRRLRRPRRGGRPGAHLGALLEPGQAPQRGGQAGAGGGRLRHLRRPRHQEDRPLPAPGPGRPLADHRGPLPPGLHRLRAGDQAGPVRRLRAPGRRHRGPGAQLRDRPHRPAPAPGRLPPHLPRHLHRPRPPAAAPQPGPGGDARGGRLRDPWRRPRPARPRPRTRPDQAASRRREAGPRTPAPSPAPEASQPAAPKRRRPAGAAPPEADAAPAERSPEPSPRRQPPLGATPPEGPSAAGPVAAAPPASALQSTAGSPAGAAAPGRRSARAA